MLIQLKTKDLKSMREKMWLANNKLCPLLNVEVEFDKTACDHIHKLKSEVPSEQRGTIRNTIEFRANAMEGKITNNWKRYFGVDETNHPISLPNYLRNLADYLEAGAYCENNTYYIHPSEKEKEQIVSKKNYNRLKKLYTESKLKAKFPEYPASKKLTVKLKSLFELFEIEPFN
jgi:hypothetical protein